MLNIPKIAYLLAGIGDCLAAPVTNITLSSRSGSSLIPTVTVLNSCSKSLKVYMKPNGGSIVGEEVAARSSHTFTVGSTWACRFWGCPGGMSSCCTDGSAVSLAEFSFAGYQENDYYDVSLVDGFNLPISIYPNGKYGSGFDCGAATCSTLLSCPSGLEGDNGACKSACTAFGTDEHCCTGTYNSGGVCKASEYSSHFKAVCPNVYTYAYDDATCATSVFGCQSDSYTVNFCA